MQLEARSEPLGAKDQRAQSSVQTRTGQQAAALAAVLKHERTEQSWALRNAQTELERRRQMAGIKPQKRPEFPSSDWLAALAPQVKEPEEKHRNTDNNPAATTVTAHPSILTAILKQNLEAAGRVYFLLLVIDQQRRGWLAIEDIRYHFTNKQSSLRICGWRRLRQIFKEGEGIFWQRDPHGRLWRTGADKIAYKLDCGRLQGFPIVLPVSALLGGIQTVRAHFYASFHSGCKHSPISRETLRGITGVAERTQQDYDQVANVRRQRNVAIGERYTKLNAEERAWRQGRGVFQFVDSHGLQGRKNGEYLAWHLPNSYVGPHTTCSRGSQKRINHKLADLYMKGITGNGDKAIERVFWTDGAKAGRAYNQNPQSDAYWPDTKTQIGRYRLWYVLSGQTG